MRLSSIDDKLRHNIVKVCCGATLTMLCVCPLIDDKLLHNIVKVAVEPRAEGEWFRSKN